MRSLLPLLLLAACAHYDNAGYELPRGSLAGTTAIVTIVPQEVVTKMALDGGVEVQRRATVNAVSIRMTNGSACFVYLAEGRDGFAALEHELWHCKGWTHK